MLRPTRMRPFVWALSVALVFAAALPSFAITKKMREYARVQYERAEKLREALEAKPAEQRKKGDYTRVIQAYQLVYHKAPTSRQAHDAVTACAELLTDEGRTFKDPKLFVYAINQYEFLQREYPGSRNRFEALYASGEIYLNELDDVESAKKTFQQFLKQYPGHELAPKAKAMLAEADKPLSARKKPEPKEVAKEKKLAKQQEEKEAEEGTSGAAVPVALTRTATPVTTAADQKAGITRLTNVRYWSTPDYTRIALDLEGEVKYEAGRVPDPDRIFFDLHQVKLSPELSGKSFEVGDGLLNKVRVAQYELEVARVVLEVDKVSEYSAFMLPNPYRLIIDIHGKKPATLTAKAEAPRSEAKTAAKEENGVIKATTAPTSKPTFESVTPREEPAKTEKAEKKDEKQETKSAKAEEEEAPVIRAAKPTANGERSLIRALGLKINRIVIDAGHGGHDTGTIGAHGLEEKELVLDVALRLGKLLESKMGAEVIYTRDDDTFIPLENRTAYANQHQADLFISIHANSSRNKNARGIETYYLNFTQSADALEVAARENAVSEKSIYELQDLVKQITLTEKIEESREFAVSVQQALHSNMARKDSGLKNRGVKKAPFVVLIGANMPSILAEISFISNPTDAKKLKTPDYRQKIAESLYKGMANYVDGLSGVTVAAKSTKSSGR